MDREYADFRVSSDGEVQGVGLLIASDPNSGKLVVLAPIVGGPADRAGMLPGDEVPSPPPLPRLLLHGHCVSVTNVHPETCHTYLFFHTSVRGSSC